MGRGPPTPQGASAAPRATPAPAPLPVGPAATSPSQAGQQYSQWGCTVTPRGTPRLGPEGCSGPRPSSCLRGPGALRRPGLALCHSGSRTSKSADPLLSYLLRPEGLAAVLQGCSGRGAAPGPARSLPAPSPPPQPWPRGHFHRKGEGFSHGPRPLLSEL